MRACFKSLPSFAHVTALKRRWKHEARQANSKILSLSLAFVIIMAATTAGFNGSAASGQREITLAFASNLSQDTNSEKVLTGESNSDNVHVYYGVQPPYARTPLGKNRVQLVNNEEAADPTWQQLRMFLLADETDLIIYDSLSYPCGAYAEDIHNNAEATGIRAAWVVVEFADNDIRHALNAFRTTDRGWLWIDCTQICPISLPQTRAEGDSYSQDKVAYIAFGKEYALIDLGVATGFEYLAYEEHSEKILEYESVYKIYYQKAAEYMIETKKYDEWISLTTDADEINKAYEWYEQLEQEKVSLDMLKSYVEETRANMGSIWGTMGRVVSVEIYW